MRLKSWLIAEESRFYRPNGQYQDEPSAIGAVLMAIVFAWAADFGKLTATALTPTGMSHG